MEFLLTAFGFLKNLTPKTWMYVILAFAIAGEQAYIYHLGSKHAYAKVAALTIKATTEQAAKDAKDAKSAVKESAKEADELHALEQKSKDNQEKANELSKADTDCPLTDDQREFLQSIVNDANKTK